MLATGLTDPDRVWQIPWREGGHPVSVTPVAAILGANASGKTNVLRAMWDMRALVLGSFSNLRPGGSIPRRRFQLDPVAENEPSRFEIDLVLSGVRHEYGFSLDDKHVVEEWAYRFPKGRAALIFHRREAELEFGSSLKSRLRSVREIVRPNSLFLSAAASANNSDLMPLFDWFHENLRLAESQNRNYRQIFSAEMLADEEHRAFVLALLKAADLGVTNVRMEPADPALQERLDRAVRIISGDEGDSETGTEIVEYEAMGFSLTHRGTAGEIELDASDESLGTLIWLGLVGPVVESLTEGSVFLVDELDASLHPMLVSRLIRLFEDPKTNPRRAQLIFNTHDVTILGDSTPSNLVSRDQIWFTEKLNDGRSRLYPLSDFSPRKGEAIARRYIAGRYGATPIISDEQFSSVAESLVPEAANE